MSLKRCQDCAHCIDMCGAPMCTSPKLAPFLDSSGGFTNTMTGCEGVRDMKALCGHRAQWFVAIPAETQLEIGDDLWAL